MHRRSGADSVRLATRDIVNADFGLLRTAMRHRNIQPPSAATNSDVRAPAAVATCATRVNWFASCSLNASIYPSPPLT